mmetsp:Transcript_63399/g.124515  ORF Transcript_63399/g.124515 Transcript_63399/m.124515 type:complete len:435 (+) Transcript_63399:63-1367(+)
MSTSPAIITCGICFDVLDESHHHHPPLHENFAEQCFLGTRGNTGESATTTQPFSCCGPCGRAFVAACIRSRDVRSLVCPSPSCKEPLTSQDVHRLLTPKPLSTASAHLSLLSPYNTWEHPSIQACNEGKREKGEVTIDTNEERGRLALLDGVKIEPTCTGEVVNVPPLPTISVEFRATVELLRMYEEGLCEVRSIDERKNARLERRSGGGTKNWLRAQLPWLRNVTMHDDDSASSGSGAEVPGGSGGNGSGGDGGGGGDAVATPPPEASALALAWWTAVDSVSFQLWRVGANAKMCPGCQAIIEKNGGCNHMTCRACRHQFHWCCGQTYGSGGHNEYLCLPNKIATSPSPLWGPVLPVRMVTKTAVGATVGVVVVAVGAAAAVGAVAGGLVLAVPVGGPLYIAGRAAGVGPLAPAGSLGDPDEIKVNNINNTPP